MKCGPKGTLVLLLLHTMAGCHTAPTSRRGEGEDLSLLPSAEIVARLVAAFEEEKEVGDESPQKEAYMRRLLDAGVRRPTAPDAVALLDRVEAAQLRLDAAPACKGRAAPYYDGVGAFVSLESIEGFRWCLRERYTGLMIENANGVDLSGETVTPESGLRELRLPHRFSSPPKLLNLRLDLLDGSWCTFGDLAWIRTCEIEHLVLDFSSVTNLGGLAGSRVDVLSLTGSSISELASLRGCAVRILDISDTHVSDVSSLARTGLERLTVSSDMPQAALEVLRRTDPSIHVDTIEPMERFGDD